MADNETSYQPPVDQLLRLGDPRPVTEASVAPWRDYRALGLSEVDVPELIRLVSDENLHSAPPDDDAAWAPLHAWRALAQLEAVNAAWPLLRLANFLDRQGDDWFLEEFPEVFACFGAAAVVPLAEFLAGIDNAQYARIMAGHSLCKIGQGRPDARGTAVAHLRDQLAGCGDNDDALNAFLISYLLQLSAVEAAEVIERAYASGRVDEGVVGRWDDVRAELGVPGMGIVTKDSPRNPDSLREVMGSIRRPNGAGGYGEIVRTQRRERKKHRRRRR
jgi:hypothetical protein